MTQETEVPFEVTKEIIDETITVGAEFVQWFRIKRPREFQKYMKMFQDDLERKVKLYHKLEKAANK